MSYWFTHKGPAEVRAMSAAYLKWQEELALRKQEELDKKYEEAEQKKIRANAKKEYDTIKAGEFIREKNILERNAKINWVLKNKRS